MLDVPGMDAAEEWLRDQVHSLGSEPGPKELRDRDILGFAVALKGCEEIAREAETRMPRQKVVRQKCAPCQRETEQRRRREPKQAVTAEDKGARRADLLNAIAESELAREIESRGLRRKQRVGTGLDRETLDALGPDQSTRSRSRLQHSRPKATPLEFVRGGKTRDAGANDGDLSQIWKFGNLEIWKSRLRGLPAALQTHAR